MMRHRVHWQSENSADGADDRSYTAFLRNWPCEIVPVSGGEVFRGKQIEATVNHVITGRRVQGALPTMRLYDELNTRYFDIHRIFEVGGVRHDIEVHATEVVA